MSEPELLPCPFCEPLRQKLIGHPKIVAYGDEAANPCVENWHGLCVACGAEGPKAQTPQGAIAAWNRRTPASAVLPEARSADTPTREAALRLIEGYANRKKRTDFEDDALTVARALLSPQGGNRGSARSLRSLRPV
jgi:hypothetical protein